MSGAAFDAVKVRWADGHVWVDADTPATENKRFGYIEDSSITSRQQAIDYGTRWLASHQDVVDQTDIGVHVTSSTLVPWTGIEVGDAVRAPNRSGVLETGRVHGTGFTGLGRAGYPKWSFTLGSAAQELDVRNQRQLTKIAQGSMRGTFWAAQTNPVPSYGSMVSGKLPWNELRMADTDELSLGESTSPLPFDEPTAVIRFQCTSESLVGSDDTVIAVHRLTYSGASITDDSTVLTITWPGNTRQYSVLCDISFTTSQKLQLVCTSPGAHALLNVKPIGSSLN